MEAARARDRVVVDDAAFEARLFLHGRDVNGEQAVASGGRFVHSGLADPSPLLRKAQKPQHVVDCLDGNLREPVTVDAAPPCSFVFGYGQLSATRTAAAAAAASATAIWRVGRSWVPTAMTAMAAAAAAATGSIVSEQVAELLVVDL